MGLGERAGVWRVVQGAWRTARAHDRLLGLLLRRKVDRGRRRLLLRRGLATANQLEQLRDAAQLGHLICAGGAQEDAMPIKEGERPLTSPFTDSLLNAMLCSAPAAAAAVSSYERSSMSGLRYQGGIAREAAPFNHGGSRAIRAESAWHGVWGRSPDAFGARDHLAILGRVGREHRQRARRLARHFAAHALLRPVREQAHQRGDAAVVADERL